MKKQAVIIKKLGGKRSNISLVKSPADLPAELQKSISFEDGILTLTCEEGEEKVELGANGKFICWEKSEQTSTGYNLWCKTNGFDTIDVIDGQYFERTRPVKAMLVQFDGQIPDFMSGAKIDIGNNNEVILHAEWGNQIAVPGQKYMFLSYEEGTFALLDLVSESANQYFVCDEGGNITNEKLVDWISQ